MRNLGLAYAFGLVACTGTVDGGHPAPPSDLQVTVADGSAPVAGALVIFQDSDDNVIGEVMTDASGLASAKVGTGNVTVIRTYPAPVPPDTTYKPAEVYTVIGAKGGDHLLVGHPTPAMDEVPPSAINVTLADTIQGNVTIDTPCGSGTGTAPIIALTVYACPAQLPVYVTDGGGGAFFAMAPFSTNIDMSAYTFTQSLSTSLTAVNITMNTQVNATVRLVGGGWTAFQSTEQRIDQTPANVDLPQLAGAELATVARITDMNNHSQMVTTHGPFIAGSLSVDASANLIAFVGDQPIYAPTGISWVEEGGVPADAVLTQMQVTRGGPVNPNNQYVRSIIAPYDSNSLRMPILPDSGILYNPQPGDTVTGTLGLVKVTSGYDGIRATAFSVDDITELTPMGGTLTLSYAGGTAP